MPGVSCGGWSVSSLFTCSLEHRMMDRRSFRAVLNVMEPPMAFRVLNVTRAAAWACFGIEKVVFQCTVACYTHFSDSIADPAELGQFIDAFFSDHCAVHIETHSFGSPEKLLRLQKGRHRAAKVERDNLKDRTSCKIQTGPAADISALAAFARFNEALKAMNGLGAVKH